MRSISVNCLLVIAALAWPALAHAQSVPPRQDFACETGERILADRQRLQAAAGALRAARPVRILAIGSSSTEGVGASSPALSYPARLEAFLQQRWGSSGVVVVNAGIGGESAGRTLERLRERLAETAFDVVIWQVGTNDAVHGHDEDRFRSVLGNGIRIVREARADLLIVDQQFFPGIRDRQRYERFVDVVAEEATANRVPLFSRYRLMRGWNDRGDAALRATLAPDAFHMNDLGYACLARLLAADLADLAQFAPTLAAAPRSITTGPALTAGSLDAAGAKPGRD